MIRTRAEAEEHQRRHGFKMPASASGADSAVSGQPGRERAKEPIKRAKDRMNKTEREYSLILEAMKRRSEVVEWRFEGLSLSWGADPETGRQMWYTPDFYIVQGQDVSGITPFNIKLVEVKGEHMFDRDIVRFKGCRAAWPMIRFEMWQKKRGEWRRIH